MVLTGGNILTPAGVFERLDIAIDGNKIRKVGQLSEQGQNLTGYYIVPGLIDLHIHGAAGDDFSSGQFQQAASYLARRGVTSFCATMMSLKPKALQSAVRTACHFTADQQMAQLVGISLEGPFLSPEKCGAQHPDALQLPEPELIRQLSQIAGGKLRMITVAPELPGATDCIRQVSALCRVSLGHTCADYDTAAAAFQAGASHLTHLYNAMPPLLHRAPGVIGAAADFAQSAELICDGIHVHPAAARAAFRLFAPHTLPMANTAVDGFRPTLPRICLISDSMEAAGLPDGRYSLGGQVVFAQHQRATLPDGTLAGSVASLADCVHNAIQWGIPPETAFAAATMMPARILGIAHQTGSIAPGKQADLLVLDQTFRMQRVLLRGRWLDTI